MKKAKKFLFKLIILLILAAAVFFIGWVSFFVKSGTCSIMTSKTGGVLETPLEHGKFLWRAERLLPTNVNLMNFKLSDYHIKKTYSGSLPSANLYKIYINPNPDFSYDIQLTLNISVKPETFLKAVKENSVTNQEEFDSYLEQKCQFAGQKVTDFLLKKSGGKIQLTLTEEDINSIFTQDDFFRKNVTIESIEITKCKIPDIEVYERAKESYKAYQAELDSQLKAKAQEQAGLLVEEDRTMSHLERFSELLKKYPELQEFAKNNDINTFMNTIRNLK